MSKFEKVNGHLPPEQSPLTPRGREFIDQHVLQPWFHDRQFERVVQFERGMDGYVKWYVEGTIARMERQIQQQEGELNV